MCESMKLKIHHCSGKLRAATFGRGVWETELCQESQLNTAHRIESKNLVWNKDMALAGDLVIASGGQLTINSDVSIPRHGRVIVERGGQIECDRWFADESLWRDLAGN